MYHKARFRCKLGRATQLHQAATQPYSPNISSRFSCLLSNTQKYVVRPLASKILHTTTGSALSTRWPADQPNPQPSNVILTPHPSNFYLLNSKPLPHSMRSTKTTRDTRPTFYILSALKLRSVMNLSRPSSSGDFHCREPSTCNVPPNNCHTIRWPTGNRHVTTYYIDIC